MNPLAQQWIDEAVLGSPVAQSLGVRLMTAKPDEIILAMKFDAHLSTTPGVIHGGVVATLIDIAGAAASASGVTTQTATGGATSQLAVHYLAPAVDELTAEATVVNRTRSSTLTHVRVVDNNGSLIATGEVTSRIFHR